MRRAAAPMKTPEPLWAARAFCLHVLLASVQKEARRIKTEFLDLIS